MKRALLGALAWMVAAELSRKYAVGGLEMSLVWPPDGIALGLVLAYGRGMIPAVGSGVVMWHMQRGVSIGESLIGAGALMLALYAAWWLMRWVRHSRPAANPVTAALRYHLLTLLPASAILAALGSWQYLLGDASAQHSWSEIVLVMAISELFGILLFARLTTLLVEALDHRDTLSQLDVGWWQLWWLLSLGLLVAMGNMGSALDRGQFGGVSASVRYAVFPLVAWAAFAGRPLFVHLATALAALALLGLTPTDLPDGQRATLILDQAVLVMCLAGLGFFASAAMEHQRSMEASLRELSRIDALTGMLNERGLTQRLGGALHHHQLVGLNVYNIEQIEDLIGMQRARQIEEDIAHLLRDHVPDAHLFARVRDGFFVISLPPSWRGEEFTIRLQQVLEGRRYMLGEQGVRVRVTMSVLDTRTRAMRQDEILAALILGCRIAGDSDGLGLVAVSEPPDILIRARQQQLSRVEALREALRHPAASAVDGTGLWLACQPIRAAQDGKRDLGVEVLLRWNVAPGIPHPPSEFLPLAERHGLMPLVDRWVVAQVVQALAHYAANDLVLEKISINLSGASMSDAQLPDYIAEAIRTSGMPANRFCFEITESTNIAQRSQAVSLLTALRKLGAQTSLDDFGTGLATFDHLKTLPLDFVKIDGSFIRNILTSRVDQRIVMSTCDVARAMGLKTVAEFVENPSQRTLLAAYGVDFVQGYGISKPVPFNAYLALNRQPQDTLPA